MVSPDPSGSVGGQHLRLISELRHKRETASCLESRKQDEVRLQRNSGSGGMEEGGLIDLRWREQRAENIAKNQER